MKNAKSTSAKSASTKTVAVKTTAKKHSGFKKGSGCYDCGICGKKTRAINGDAEHVGLCVACYEKAGDENAVLDGHMTQDDFNAKYGETENFLNDGKMAAANDVEPEAEVTPQTLINDAVETLNALTAETPAEEKAAVIEKAVETVKAANAPKATKEKLTLPKLRRVGDIKNVLKAGGSVIRENGLYRLLLADGQKQPVSKRRCVAMITKKLVVPAENGWVLAPEVPAEEKK
jgi:hypothetical protein